MMATVKLAVQPLRLLYIMAMMLQLHQMALLEQIMTFSIGQPHLLAELNMNKEQLFLI